MPLSPNPHGTGYRPVLNLREEMLSISNGSTGWQRPITSPESFCLPISLSLMLTSPALRFC